MFNVCLQCGQYNADKIIETQNTPEGWARAVCPQCGHAHRFRYLPLLLVTGASGTGKTTISYALSMRIRGFTILDNDILWQPEFNSNNDNNQRFFETWLRMCKNLHQSAQQVVLFGAGTGVPENMDNCTEMRYFSHVHRLAYVCDDKILAERLCARPAWRGSSHDEFIEAHIEFNNWFRTTGPMLHPPIDIFDTSDNNLEQTLAFTEAWVKNHAVATSFFGNWTA